MCRPICFKFTNNYDFILGMKYSILIADLTCLYFRQEVIKYSVHNHIHCHPVFRIVNAV